MIAVPVGTVKATEGEEVLFEGETEEQYIRVVEQEDGDRLLELNEGQAVHSLYRPGSYLTDDVWDGYLVLPFAGRDEPPRRMAILGNAAGTTARAYGRYFPETEVDGVEIDAKLTELGERYFDLDNPRLEVFHEDARPWLEDSEGGYDVIMVDAYRQPYIPFYLATREFFELARDRLAPGGVVIVNAGHPEGNDDLETVLGRTLADVFATVIRDPIEDTNTLLLASEGPAERRPPRRGGAAPARGPAGDRGPRVRPDRAPPSRGRGLHRRPGAGRVADRPLDPRLRGGGLTPDPPPQPLARVEGERTGGRAEVDRERGEAAEGTGVEPGAEAIALAEARLAVL